jgi:hypothetical protein
MKEFEGRSMRANVILGTAGETILEHGFEQKIAEPRYAGPTLYVGLTMRSQIEAISPLVDQLMPLIKAGHHVSCRIYPGKELTIVVQDDGNGFDPAKIPDPTAHISVVKATLDTES